LGFRITEADKIEEIKGIGERGVPIIIKIGNQNCMGVDRGSAYAFGKIGCV